MACEPIAMKEYLTRRQVAERYPISASTLAQLASRGAGPKFYKPVNLALYLAEDVEAWIEESVVLTVTSTTVRERADSRKCNQALARKSDQADSDGICDADCVETASPNPRRGRPRKSLSPSSGSFIRTTTIGA